METINWENLRLHLAPHSAEARETSIGGVGCNDIIYEPTDNEVGNGFINKSLEDILKETLFKLNAKTNDETPLKMVLALMLMISTSFFVLFLIPNYDRIRKHCRLSNFVKEPLSATYNSDRAETLLL